MPDIYRSIYDLSSIEKQAGGDSAIHTLSALAKLVTSFFYILCIASLGRYSLPSLCVYILYPILLTSLAELSLANIIRRSLPALPFCLMAGIANLFSDTAPHMYIGSLAISGGAISLVTLCVKALLCVGCVNILASTTPMYALTGALRAIHLPELAVSLFEMTFRYTGTLLNEASTMYTAYSLRSGLTKGVAMKNMGSFAGQLFIRSYERAQRVYAAMKCRLYPAAAERELLRLKSRDIIYMLIVCTGALLLRLVDISVLIASLFGGL